MRGKKVFFVALAATSAVALGSCGPKWGFNYADYEVDNPNASVSVSNSGTAQNFVASSYEEREEILGLLEKYSIENNLSGITLYSNAALAKYSQGIKSPITTGEGQNIKFQYVDGYGFGVVEEGTSSTGKYRLAEPEDPNTINYMNDKGSVVGNYHPYVASGYFGNRLKYNDGKFEAKYEWYPALGTEDNKVGNQVRPVPVVDGQPQTGEGQLTKLNNTYRIYVRTDIKYGIATTNSNLSKYNGQQVKLEDYITPWQQLLTQANGLARGAENLTGAQAIKGTAEYYNASKDGFNQAAWDNVGIKANTDEQGRSYIDFEFVTPCTPFYAMYYLSSSLYTPLPKEFVEDIGGIKNYGSFTQSGLTPVDTTLSTGPYVVKSWQSDKQIVFSQNTQTDKKVRGGEQRYKINEIEVMILKAMGTDPMAAWNEFKAGKLDVAGVPKTLVQQEQTAPYVQKSKGDSTFKLNLNTCTPEEWEELFGVSGSVTSTPESQYWEVEPAMSNDNFVKGLSASLNRVEYAKKRGKDPSVEYFSDNYLMNPEEGISYNDTETHKNLMKEMYGDDVETNYGYSETKAVEYFKTAADELIKSGAYSKGDTIEIEIAWMFATDIEENGLDIKQYFESTWKKANTGLNLVVNNMSVANWQDVYYQKMMVGQFDIAIGGISGNTLNPINFMEVLKSDNSSGFTLNYSGSTNDPEKTITYDGHKYTFDALFQAADTGAVVEDSGKLAVLADTALLKSHHNESDGSRTVAIKYALANVENTISNELKSVALSYVDAKSGEAAKFVFEEGKNMTIENGVITVTVPKEIVEKAQGAVEIVLVVDQKVVRSEDDDFASLKPVEVSYGQYVAFPVWEPLH